MSANRYPLDCKLTPISNVQNAPWARQYLFRKYNISDNSGAVKNAFSSFAKSGRPQHRGGRPVLNARAFRVDRDNDRKIWRTAYGFDYLRYLPARNRWTSSALREVESKLFELNTWEESGEYDSRPAYGYDVYVQRMSVYIQRNMDEFDLHAAQSRLPSQNATSTNGNSRFTSPAVLFDNSKSS